MQSKVAQLPYHFAACIGSEPCSKCEQFACSVAGLANNHVHQLLRLYLLCAISALQVNRTQCPYCDTEYGVYRHGETWTESDPCVEYICNVRAYKTACYLCGLNAIACSVDGVTTRSSRYYVSLML